MARRFKNVSGIDQYFYDKNRDLMKVLPNGEVEGDEFASYAARDSSPLRELILSKSENGGEGQKPEDGGVDAAEGGSEEGAALSIGLADEAEESAVRKAQRGSRWRGAGT